MFQNAWSCKSVKSQIESTVTFPENHISPTQIAFVRSIYWDEHCLECSAPACYSTCAIYRKRPDGACRRFEYGIKVMKPFNNTLSRVRLKFRKWAKLEARINRGTMTVAQMHQIDSKDCLITNVFKLASAIGRYSISRKWDGLRRKKYADLATEAPYVSDFLLQCQYNGKEKFNLLFEIADRQNTVIFKSSILISPGYNQELLKLEFPLPVGGLVRIYPENNLSPELEIYAADFVLLKGNMPANPAKKVKCVAWDLDNTVWDGILAESNPESLTMRKDVSNIIREFDSRGIIQIVVSKNDRENVEPVLHRLGINDYFVYVLANWNPKSENIYYASKLLNIGIDTFALIDDSEYERSEVNETLPSVRVYDEKNLAQLLERDEFNLPVTADGSKRRLSYQQEASRKKIRDSFGGQNAEFIKNCNIEVSIGKIETDEQRKRCIELLMRTNQLNLSAHRYSDTEFDSMLDEPNSQSIILNIRDRFGDYGIVAFVHYIVSDEKLMITEYAMSCRVAAKMVENALFHWLQCGYGKDIIANGKHTDRNSTLIDALTKVGFQSTSEDPSLISLELNSGTSIPNNDCVKIICCEH